MDSIRLLAEVKLRETQRQRDRLHKQYDAIEARVEQAVTPLDRLRVLHEGLREITFAQKPLHPDIANLDALYLADELGTVPPELIADRTALLEREMAQGRMRAEFTYAFGRILNEWTGPEADAATEPDDSPDGPLSLLWSDPPAPDHAWLEAFFRANRAALRPVTEAVAKFAATKALAPVHKGEVHEALGHIAQDNLALPGLRREAAAVAASEAHVNEYCGVLTIMVNSLDEWDWPAEGVPLRAAWARVKHRPYLDENLVTALFLHVLGMRWGWELKSRLAWENLREGKERVFRGEPPSSPTARITEQRISVQGYRFLAALKERGRDTGYGPDALRHLFSHVEGEIRFAALTAPGRPLYVVQGDLRDYYPSLSHELILTCLKHLGVPERWLAFFRKFLAARARYRGEVRAIRRGVVLEHLLADIFAEVVLFVLDVHVYRTTGLPVLRVIDDLWLLTDSHEKATAAWREVRAFCRACGLEVNEAKSGAVCMGTRPGPLDGLPSGRPRWGLLRLKADGVWEVEEPALARLEETIRKQLTASPSVLSLVALYNGYVNYILWQMAPAIVLRGDHLRRVGQRIHRMHEGLFGPGHGLVDEVRRRLSGLFADARLKERGLPSALIYWPITAGGLALVQPTLRIASFLAARSPAASPQLPSRELVAAYLRRREKSLKEEDMDDDEYLYLLGLAGPKAKWKVPPREDLLAEYRARVAAGRATPPTEDDDEVTAQVWEDGYGRLVEEIEPADPPKLAAMERLVSDFINRGTEVSGRKQQTLSPYWRWVVYTYGPSLLEALGTFRFLMTELVPLQLILETRGGLPSGSGAGRVGGTQGESVPF